MSRADGYMHRAYVDFFRDWRAGSTAAQRRMAFTRTVPGTMPVTHRLLPIFGAGSGTLGEDIGSLGEDLVAVSLVTDPFGDFEPAMLRTAFPDRCFPFKEHLVADLSVSRITAISSQHRREARRALRHFGVELCTVHLSFSMTGCAYIRS